MLDFYHKQNNAPLKIGYFVDIGAHDGVQLSNTKLLEEQGWVGICAEPNPKTFPALCENRKGAFLVNKAVWHTTGTKMEFAVCDEVPMLSGLTGFAADEYKQVHEASRKVEVTTISFNDLLKQAAAPRFIEYLSIDTEGCEFEILASLDFEKYVFGLIDVEHNYHEEKRRSIRDLLEGKGYALLRENKWDDCYVHHSQRMGASV